MSGSTRRLNNAFQKPRRSTSFSLVFPTVPSLAKEPRKVELHQKQKHHDVMVITFTTTGGLWFDELHTGVPIKFSWSQGLVSNEWYGYVSSISKTVATQRERIMQVHCVGSSFPLKERVTQTFSDATVPEIAEQIAAEHSMGFSGDSHARRFSQLTIAGHSYWEWLQEQASRIGFAMFVENNVLYFKDFDSIINKDSSSVPVLYSDISASRYHGQYFDRTLDLFRVLKGEYVEDNSPLRTEKNAGGINPFTEEVITATMRPDDVGDALRSNVSDVLFSEYRTDQVVGSYLDAESASKGAAAMARFNLPARIKCAGDPRISPYHPVRILGTGELTDGFWLVREATHIFQKFGDYNIEAVIVTDGTGANNVTAFRGRTPAYMSTVNIMERLDNPQINIDLSTNLSITSPNILPKEQGYKRSPSLWQTIPR